MTTSDLYSAYLKKGYAPLPEGESFLIESSHNGKTYHFSIVGPPSGLLRRRQKVRIARELYDLLGESCDGLTLTAERPEQRSQEEYATGGVVADPDEPARVEAWFVNKMGDVREGRSIVLDMESTRNTWDSFLGLHP